MSTSTTKSKRPYPTKRSAETKNLLKLLDLILNKLKLSHRLFQLRSSQTDGSKTQEPKFTYAVRTVQEAATELVSKIVPIFTQGPKKQFLIDQRIALAQDLTSATDLTIAEWLPSSEKKDAAHKSSSETQKIRAALFTTYEALRNILTANHFFAHQMKLIRGMERPTSPEVQELMHLVDFKNDYFLDKIYSTLQPFKYDDIPFGAVEIDPSKPLYDPANPSEGFYDPVPVPDPFKPLYDPEHPHRGFNA